MELLLIRNIEISPCQGLVLLVFVVAYCVCCGIFSDGGIVSDGVSSGVIGVVAAVSVSDEVNSGVMGEAAVVSGNEVAHMDGVSDIGKAIVSQSHT